MSYMPCHFKKCPFYKRIYIVVCLRTFVNIPCTLLKGFMETLCASERSCFAGKEMHDIKSSTNIVKFHTV